MLWVPMLEGEAYIPPRHTWWRRRQCAKIYGTFRWTIGVCGAPSTLGPVYMAAAWLSHRSSGPALHSWPRIQASMASILAGSPWILAL